MFAKLTSASRPMVKATETSFSHKVSKYIYTEYIKIFQIFYSEEAVFQVELLEQYVSLWI